MKKIIIILIICPFFINSMNKIELSKGLPRINHYGPPYLAMSFNFVHSPKSLLDVAPDNLILQLIKNIEPGNTSSDVKMLRENLSKKIESNEIDLKFYSIVWVYEDTQWPADKKFNLIYHEILRNWLKPTPGFTNQEFNANIAMGLFAPNGVVRSQTGTIDSNSISFEHIEPRNVNFHYTPGNIGKLWEGLYSPNNAFFYLAPDREIASFWSVAISPNKTDVNISGIPTGSIVVPVKKNIIVIFNTLIDDPQVVYFMNELQKAGNNLKTRLNAISNIAKKMENKSDAQALKEIVNIIDKTNKIDSYDNILNSLFDEKFLDEIKKRDPNILLNVSTADLANHIYQISVLSQDDPTIMKCKVYPIIGNTCGRHSYKNAIFSILLLDAFKAKNVDNFIKYAKSLTNQEGTLYIDSIDQLTKEASCIFESINKFLKDYRASQGHTEAETLSTEETQAVINNAQFFTKSCGVPVLNNSLFTVIDDLDKFTNKETLTLNQLIDILIQIHLAKTEPEYIHSFIVGAELSGKVGEHWINITVFKKNGTLNYIVMDSKNRPSLKYAEKLKTIFENSNFDTSLQDVIAKVNASDLEIQNKMTLFLTGKINNILEIKNATLKQKQNAFEDFINDLANLLINSIKINYLNSKVEIKTEFNYPEKINLINNALQLDSPLIKEYPHIKEIHELFTDVIKNKNIDNFKVSLNQLLNVSSSVLKNLEDIFNKFKNNTLSAKDTKEFSQALKKANDDYIANKAQWDKKGYDKILQDIKSQTPTLPIFIPLYNIFNEIMTLMNNKSIFPKAQKIPTLDFVTWLSNGIDSTVDQRPEPLFPLLIFAVIANKPDQVLTLLQYGATDKMIGPNRISHFVKTNITDSTKQKQILDLLMNYPKPLSDLNNLYNLIKSLPLKEDLRKETQGFSEALKKANDAYKANKAEWDKLGYNKILEDIKAQTHTLPIFAPLYNVFNEIMPLLDNKSIFPNAQKIPTLDFITWLSNGIDSTVDLRTNPLFPLLIFAVIANKPDQALTLLRYGATDKMIGPNPISFFVKKNITDPEKQKLIIDRLK